VARAGGELLIQGNLGVDIFALNNPASGLFSGGDMVLRSANTVSGDAYYTTGGNFRIERLDGSLGNLSSPYDPIVRASGDVTFDSYTGASLHILAGGSVTIAGNVSITSSDRRNSIQEDVTLSDGTTVVAIDGGARSTLDIRAGTQAFGTPGIVGNARGFSQAVPGTGGTGTSANITIGGNISTPPNSSVFLTNQYSPASVPGGTIQVNSISADTVTVDARDNITINRSVSASDGDVNLVASGNITTGNIITGLRLTSRAGASLNSGNITLMSRNGNITTGALNSSAYSFGSSDSRNSGNISLDAAGDITTRDIRTGSSVTGSSGTGEVSLNSGSIDLTSSRGNITTGILTSSTSASFYGNSPEFSVSGNGGNISLDAVGTITTGDIRTGSTITGSSATGEVSVNSGSIDLTSRNGNISAGVLNSSAPRSSSSVPCASSSAPCASFSFSASGNGGNINLNAPGTITVSRINTQSPNIGGSVDITTNGFFRTRTTLLDRNRIRASISTGGGVDGGAIFIRHGGGSLTPFRVGNAVSNGTGSAITRGALPEQTISSWPPKEYQSTYTQDAERIQIITSDTSPLPPLDASPLLSNPGTSPVLPNPNTTPLPPQPEPNPEQIAASLEQNPNPQPIPISPESSASGPDTPPSVPGLDQFFASKFKQYVGENLTQETVTERSIKDTLKTIESQTGKRAVVVYARSLPDGLELVLVPPEGPLIRKVVSQANATTLNWTVKEFQEAATNLIRPRSYLRPAQQLHRWLIKPIQSDLDALKIDTLIFCFDAGLRSLPMAALYDGKQFLVEKYSLGSIPSVSLTDTRYQPLKNARVLGMGASKFQELRPLPAVPVELNVITQQLWSGESFLNEQFTLNNLQAERRQEPFKIIHLATHADFQPGDSSNSYIQLWDTRLRLDELRQLGWYKPPQVELLVLSACNTAVGDTKSELGFAGLAVQAGVKSALASLWAVSDEGTLAMMSGFYEQLRQPEVTIKAEALRQAQIAMLRGQVQLKDGKLQGLKQLKEIPLPPEIAARGNQVFSHPYYWAGFTIIGSPW
jgi:CHAT domain-containing protein